MEMKQIYDITNGIASEVLGESNLLDENLSNIVDIGTQILDATSMDKFVGKLVDRIGYTMFVNRSYAGSTLPLYRNEFEYGAVMQKISSRLKDAVENESWQLTDGASYDPNVFHASDVIAKYYNKRTTFEMELSIADKQCRSAFNSAGELNAFFSMLEGDVDKAITIRNDALAERLINNMICQTFAAEFPTISNNNYSGVSGVRAVNLLKLYNDTFSKSLTAAACIYDADFIRFAVLVIDRYMVRLTKISKLFNNGGEARFTPSNLQHVVMHGDFKTAADVYLQSGTFNEQYTALPGAYTVPYWQGSGLGYGFSDTSTVKATIELPAGGTKSLTITGVLACIFDHDAMGITNMNRRNTTNYNPKAEFTNVFHKVDAAYFGDINENFCCFYVQ